MDKLDLSPILERCPNDLDIHFGSGNPWKLTDCDRTILIERPPVEDDDEFPSGYRRFKEGKNVTITVTIKGEIRE